MTRQSIFTVGGTVQAGSGRYIPRKVDEALCLALYRVFQDSTPRPMGC